MPEFIISTDREGTPHTVCPRGHVDAVVAVDSTVRFNRLVVDPDGRGAVEHADTGPDWESDGFLCTECIGDPDHDHSLDPPDGFEVRSPY
jgi:hypothetical protein